MYKNYIRILFLVLLFKISLVSNSMFAPIPLRVEYDKEKAFLGKKLFNDTLLSKDNSISCATCHPISNYGVDSQSISIGINGQEGDRNTPTVLNSSFNFLQLWDGRAKDLKDQAILPLISKFEMGDSLENIVDKLNSNQEYRRLFFDIYKSEVKIKNVADAIAEYEKTLITPNSKFDKYLRGDKNILTPTELYGLKLFQSKGCASCHNGVNLGGNHFQKIGYFQDHKDGDLGRYNITKNEKDKNFFKVPSLRNIAKTSPYFHDGSSKTLKDTIKTMGLLQVGRVLTEDEIDAIEAFLITLTGELPND